jgi:hypothetical protein
LTIGLESGKKIPGAGIISSGSSGSGTIGPGLSTMSEFKIEM